MSSVTDICNMALVSAGARTQIASIDDSSVAARTCKLFYDTVLLTLLGEAQWNFATKFVTLPLLSSLPGAPGTPTPTGNAPQVWSPTMPAPGWLYQYGYPDDCAHARWVIPQGLWGAYLAQAQTNGLWRALQNLAVPFIVGSNEGATVINTNAQQAILCYTEKVTNPGRYPPNFVEALAGRLAFKIVIPLSGDKVLAQGANVAAQQVVDKMLMQDANEGFTVIDNIPDWLQARDWPDNQGGGGPGWWLMGNN